MVYSTSKYYVMFALAGVVTGALFAFIFKLHYVFAFLFSFVVFYALLTYFRKEAYKKCGVTKMSIANDDFLFYRLKSLEVGDLSGTIKKYDGSDAKQLVREGEDGERIKKSNSKGRVDNFFGTFLITFFFTNMNMISLGRSDDTAIFGATVIVIAMVIFPFVHTSVQPSLEQRLGIKDKTFHEFEDSDIELDIYEISLLPKDEQMALALAELEFNNKKLSERAIAKEDMNKVLENKEFCKTMLARIKEGYPIVDDEEWLSLSRDEQIKKLVRG